MVKKVSSDQVILFSLPVEKKRGQETDRGMSARNRSLGGGDPIGTDHLTIHKNEGIRVVQAEKPLRMEHNYYRGSINVINEGSDDARGCP
jgi:hypothetical protein